MSELAPEPFRLPDLAPVPGPSPRYPLVLVAAGLVAAIVGAVALAAGRGTTAAAGRGNGVVVIQTNLAYQGAAAAGTGIVLSSSGEILTNNHVVRGATTIDVVIPSTGRTYTATVAGYDVSRDIAVLQLQGASGLKTAPLGDSAALQAGDTVTAVGNAGGTGSLTRAPGTVTALGASITANDDQGGSETLTGLIQTDADVQPGDSGGPLLDSSGRVVGVDTAASSTGGYQDISQTTAGYAVPIGAALEIVDQIESGDGSSTVHVGGTAFLGVNLQSDAYGGVSIADVVSGGAADDAGLAAGDVITAIDGRSVDSPTDVTATLLGKQPGDTLGVNYVRGGASESATVTLQSGPAQ